MSVSTRPGSSRPGRSSSHEHAGAPLRGIGEPIWSERSADELVECQRHESLLNVAFAGSADFTLLCPYDTAALEPRGPRRGPPQPSLRPRRGHVVGEPGVPGPRRAGPALSAPLPEPPGFVGRPRVPGRARSAACGSTWHGRRPTPGFSTPRSADAATAVNEIASNSLRHAGGRGVLRMWRTDDAFICEVSDDGRIEDPLVGRIRPDTGGHAGRGLWIVNQLCDLVQVRSGATGTTVRMHFRATTTHADPERSCSWAILLRTRVRLGARGAYPPEQGEGRPR